MRRTERAISTRMYLRGTCYICSTLFDSSRMKIRSDILTIRLKEKRQHVLGREKTRLPLNSKSNVLRRNDETQAFCLHLKLVSRGVHEIMEPWPSLFLGLTLVFGYKITRSVRKYLKHVFIFSQKGPMMAQSESTFYRLEHPYFNNKELK